MTISDEKYLLNTIVENEEFRQIIFDLEAEVAEQTLLLEAYRAGMQPEALGDENFFGKAEETEIERENETNISLSFMEESFARAEDNRVARIAEEKMIDNHFERKLLEKRKTWDEASTLWGMHYEEKSQGLWRYFPFMLIWWAFIAGMAVLAYQNSDALAVFLKGIFQ